MTLGHSIHWKNFRILWGNRNTSLDELRARYPGLDLVKLKQTHSDIVRVHSRANSAHGQEGDAILSREPKTILATSTADCLPVMMAQATTGWMASIHAGWRGVANGIVPSALRMLAAESGSPEGIRIWIGPHIRMESFEIGADVKDQILAAAPGFSPSPTQLRSLPGDKFLLDLSAVVTAQIATTGIAPEALSVSREDTMKTLRYHSHRRDREKAGRQQSFILSLDLR